MNFHFILFYIVIITQLFDSYDNINTLKWAINPPYHFRGYIFKDSRIVKVYPQIKINLIDDEEICEFTVSDATSTATSHNQYETFSSLFRGVVISAHLGIGQIQLKPGVNLTNQELRNFLLVLRAKACKESEHVSNPATILIKIFEAPQPKWNKPVYRIILNTDIPANSVLSRLSASVNVNPTDKIWIESINLGSNPNLFQICKYNIVEPAGSPFSIDIHGILKNQVPIILGETRQIMTLLLSASCNCGKEDKDGPNRISEVNLFIDIKARCKFGWTGIPSSINYSVKNKLQDSKCFKDCTNSLIQPIGHKIKFKFCNNTSEKDTKLSSLLTSCSTSINDDELSQQQQQQQSLRVTTSLELITSSTSSTNTEHHSCALDSHSIRLQQIICDINQNISVELLPNLFIKNIGVVEFPADSNIFPLTSIRTPIKFTLYFWIRREITKSQYQTIFNEISDSGKELLEILISSCNIRINTIIKMTGNTVLFQTISSEYEVIKLCDKKWHFVFLVLNRQRPIPQITLFVDGEMIHLSNRFPERIEKKNVIIDDQYESQSDIFIGQSPKNKKTHDFEGLLAGVVIFPDHLLIAPNPYSSWPSSSPPTLVHCLHTCSERLHFSPLLTDINLGVSLSLNTQQQTLVINARSISQVAHLLNHVAYVNPHYQQITNEMSQILINTKFKCGSIKISLEPIRINISLSNKNKDSILTNQISISLKLNNSFIFITDQSKLAKSGITIFSNLSIISHMLPINSDDKMRQISSMISKCVISTTPSLQSPLEYWDWPRDTVRAVRSHHRFIEVFNDTETITLLGPHNQHVYLFIIQNIRIFSSIVFIKNDDNELERKFTIQCQSTIDPSNSFNSNAVSIKLVYVNPPNQTLIENFPTSNPIHLLSNETKKENRREIHILHKNDNSLSSSAKFVQQHNKENHLEAHEDISDKTSLTTNIIIFVTITTVSIVLLTIATRLWKHHNNQQHIKLNHQPLPTSPSSLSSSSISSSSLSERNNRKNVPIKLAHYKRNIQSYLRNKFDYFKSINKKGVRVELSRDYQNNNNNDYKYQNIGSPWKYHYGNHRHVSLELEWDDENGDKDLTKAKSITVRSNPLCVQNKSYRPTTNKIKSLFLPNKNHPKLITSNHHKVPFSLDDEQHPPPVTDDSDQFDLEDYYDDDNNDDKFNNKIVYTDDESVAFSLNDDHK